MPRFTYRGVWLCALLCTLLALSHVKGQSGDDDDDDDESLTSSPFISPVTSPFILPAATSSLPSTSVEDVLRAAILAGNVEAAAAQMNVGRRYSVGGGLRFSQDLVNRVVRTPQRNTDPDVVAFKAIASSMLQTGDASKLAAAIAFSFIPDCTCSPFLVEEIDELTAAFQEDLLDREEMQRILAADASVDVFGRKLKVLNSSPTRSFICAHCWPPNQCRKVQGC